MSSRITLGRIACLGGSGGATVSGELIGASVSNGVVISASAGEDSSTVGVGSIGSNGIVAVVGNGNGETIGAKVVDEE